jgi:pilus assembly protein CpaB
MSVSRIVLLLVALVAGGLAAFLATRGGSAPAPDSPTQVVEVAAATTHVLVAKTNIGVGQRLSDDNITWQDWPQNAAQPGYITQKDDPKGAEEMKGAVARFELFAGEPILQAKLVKSDQGYLSAVLDKGKRGVSINVSADSASGGFIVPNDHVDVILTQGNNSQPVLTNVRVLAINTRLGETGTTGAAGDGGDANADPKSLTFSGGAIATLELTPDQTDTIINASHLGTLSLALRSIVDFAQTADDKANNDVKRNAPIRIIRYGTTTNVTTGVAPGPSDGTDAGTGDASVAPANFQPISVTPQVAPSID